jgi:hypothetical protein
MICLKAQSNKFMRMECILKVSTDKEKGAALVDWILRIRSFMKDGFETVSFKGKANMYG